MNITFRIVGSSIHLDHGYLWASVQFADLLGACTIKVPRPITKAKAATAIRAVYSARKAAIADELSSKQLLSEYVDKDITIEE